MRILSSAPRPHLARVLHDLAQEPEPLLVRRRALVFYHLDETDDLGRYRGHGRREHGVELTQVCKDAGKVEREGVEGVCVLREQR